MNNTFSYQIILILMISFSTGCNSQSTQNSGNNSKNTAVSSTVQKDFKEGTDYTVMTRARVLDRIGFSQPVEVFSYLLPRDWNYNGEVIWIMPGQAGQGNYTWFTTESPDKKWQFHILPGVNYIMSEEPFINQTNQASANQFFRVGQPMDAETYLKQFFVQEIGNPEIISIDQEEYPAAYLRKIEEGKAELQASGMGQGQTFPTAVSASVKWADGSEGIIGCLSVVIKMTMVNQYNGQYMTSYVTTIGERKVFRFPGSRKADAKKLMATISNSIQTNPAWQTTVDQFWKAARQQSRIDSWNKVRMMDEYTRQIGQNAIKKGNENLARIDANMRSWEAGQQSQDRMHNNFIKAIREVETYKDATGTYEMSSSYNHAWSRNDGSSFIMTDNPNFDPSSVFQDQQWKQMRRVKN
ncbi:MAG: hypothetical protein M9898_06960 [Chitinophagaceae bacterium]|nr:hypothetical protein [Chitinophagaceae bacterium]